MAMYDGPQNIRDRDMYMPQYQRNATSPKEGPVLAPLQEFKYKRTGAKPIIFKPDGSFESLKMQGKLTDPSTHPGEDSRYTMREKKHFMPGYTGFIRGHQHISGRTYGEMTRRAYDTGFEEHVRTSPVPSAPQSNRKVRQAQPQDTFVTNNLAHRTNHVPGYTGHVPGMRACYSKTYGETTMSMRDDFQRTNPRRSPQEEVGYAYTTKPRALLPIDSAPIPGTNYRKAHPTMMIDGHLNYVKFFAT